MDLPVDVSNIDPGSPMATKFAHYTRLKEGLPDPCKFGDQYCEYSLKGTLSKPIEPSISQR